MDSHLILEKIDSCLKDAKKHGLQKKGLTFPIDPALVEDDELRDICSRLASFFDMLNEAFHYSEQLAQGNLQVNASRANIFTMSLKGLHASLTHLTWQVNQVAKGDLNQQVYFLGEFSNSFNDMIDSLREKQILEQKLKIITDVLGEGLFLVDSDGKIIFSNPEALKLLGYTFNEIEGALIHIGIFKQLPDGTIFQPGENPLCNAIQIGNDYNESNGVFTCKSGFMIPVMVSSRPVYKNDTLDGAVITFRDITEQKKNLETLETINRLLEKQALTDALTGIHNRMKFDKILTSEIQRAQRNNSILSLIIFDIDHFKQVNDTYGHSAGDNVLIRLTRLITCNIRVIDFFARWGGEEFVVLSPGTGLDGVIQLAEKLRGKVEGYNFKEPGKITLSFGVTTFHDGDTDTVLINRADNALYRAKESGRNQVQYN